MASPEVIDVDADEPPRIVGGTGKPDAPLEIASSDSEDENPAKRAKPAPVGRARAALRPPLVVPGGDPEPVARGARPAPHAPRRPGERNHARPRNALRHDGRRAPRVEARAAAGRRGRAEDVAHRPTGHAGIPEEEGSRAVLVRVSKFKSNSYFWGGLFYHQLASVLQPLARCLARRVELGSAQSL